MTVEIGPELEVGLRELASARGLTPDEVAVELLRAALEFEERERSDAAAGIRKGLDDSAAGRVRPAEEVFAKMRALLDHR